MIEPLSILAGVGAAADLGELVAAAKAWIDGDELDRLLDHLDEVFGETTGLSATQLETWKEDQGFCTALFAISYTADWEGRRASLRGEVLRLTAEDARDPRPDEAELVDEVVAEIEAYLPHAKQGDEVTRYTGRQNLLATERAQVQLWSSDWAPEPSQDFLDQLAGEHPTEATYLQDALKDRDAKTEITSLLRVPPRWLADGSGLLWETLATIAEGVGLWPVALQAWDKAFECRGSDRARARVRATTAAHISGDPEGGEARLAEAEEVDQTHPLVLFAKAQQSRDPETTLALLDSIEPRKDSQAAIRDARRAIPLAELERWEEVDAALATARQADVPEIELREIEADVTVLRNKAAWLRGSRTDMEGLNEAADLYLERREVHRERNANEGSVAYLSKAAEALIVADERRRAAALMDPANLLDEELAAPGTRPILGEQLMKAGRPDLAVTMLEQADDDDEGAQLVLAISKVQVADEGADLGEVIELLDETVAEGEHRLPAAHARIIASLHGQAGWSESAFELLSDAEPGLAALFRARWLANEEEWDEAERVLRPHMAEEPRAQHALLEIALERGEPERIAIRAKEILGQDSDFAVRLEAARALTQIGKQADAEEELQTLCRAEEAPLELRLSAFPELAELLQHDERYRELLALTAAWLALEPGSPNAIWGRAYCLFRLGRFGEALALLDNKRPQPRMLSHAQLAARLYGLALEGEEAVMRIVEIADTLEEPDETIEALALFSTLGIAADLPRELLERVNPARFTRLFPESNLVRSVEAPDSPGQLLALLREVAGDRPERIAHATEAVFEKADSPVALIALAGGESVAETWQGLHRRPTGFGIAALAEDERANAASALTLGAVWDAGSLYLASALGSPFEERLRRALPKSVVPQSVLDDALAGEQGGPELAGRIAELARGMEIEPDAPAEDAGPEATAIRENELTPQMLTFAGSLAVARRLGLPVFSADRLVRLHARQAGLRAFGPESAIDALTDSGEQSAEERDELRRRLRELGALGTRSSAAELVADARSVEFRLTDGVAQTLRDVTPLRADTIEWYATLLDFLRAVQRETPERLGLWTARVIDALHQNAPESPVGWHASRLLVFAWDPTTDDDPFLEPFAVALKKAIKYLGGRDDPIIGTARLLNGLMLPHFDLGNRVGLIGRFADQMPPGDSFRVRLVPLESGS